MSASGRNATDYACLNTAAEQCGHVDNGRKILAACGTMTALACLTLVARVYTRVWMAHSTDRDDYTMWIAVVRRDISMAISIAYQSRPFLLLALQSLFLRFTAVVGDMGLVCHQRISGAVCYSSSSGSRFTYCRSYLSKYRLRSASCDLRLRKLSADSCGAV
jgi:hypothetical protein